MDETGYIAHQRRSSKASSLVSLGGRNKKAPGKALVCVWLGGEGVRLAEGRSALCIVSVCFITTQKYLINH
jgi:hypothetical protein